MSWEVTHTKGTLLEVTMETNRKDIKKKKSNHMFFSGNITLMFAALISTCKAGIIA